MHMYMYIGLSTNHEVVQVTHNIGTRDLMAQRPKVSSFKIYTAGILTKHYYQQLYYFFLSSGLLTLT